MIKKITPLIWYGDKPSVTESIGQVNSVINVASSLKRPYWKELGKLSWETWYFRIASPDRSQLNDDYMKAMEAVLSSIKRANKFPLLCHCKMGGHRGPTAAFFAAYFLDGANRLDYWLNIMDEIHPNFSKEHRFRVYRKCVIDYCRNGTISCEQD